MEPASLVGTLLIYLFWVLAITLLIALYLLPAYVASNRKHKNAGVILLLNIFLGYTLVAWLILLIWAYSGEDRSKME